MLIIVVNNHASLDVGHDLYVLYSALPLQVN